MNPRPPSYRARLGLLAGGLLMGVADTIPGVSGGTVAMVLGIYDQLVTAISRCDTTLLGLVIRGRWREAAARIELGFLLTLGLGIGIGILALASVMMVLLQDYPSLVNAVFFGLVAGSCLVVGQSISSWTRSRAVMMMVAILVSYVLVGFPSKTVEPVGGRLDLFFSGAIAICAMILPGISGAFLLKVMGQYDRVIGLLSDLVHGQATSEQLVTLVVFSSGCLVGLISFSKLLRWLLANNRDATLAVLCGAMCGSLRVLWPLGREQLTGGGTATVALLMVAGFGVVLLLDRIARQGETRRSEDREQQQSAGSD